MALTQPRLSDRPAAGRQYFFVHIPKTAGSSFEEFLCSHFSPERVLRRGYWEAIRKQPIAALTSFQLITGRVGYDLAFYLRDPFIVTLLRHPVDRLCSAYEYLHQLFEADPALTLPDPDVNELVQLWKIVVQRPFADFLDSTEEPVRAAFLENPQARQLAQPTPYLLTDFSDDHLFHLASSRLRTIDVVGCAEYFAETVDLTCRRIGWVMPRDLGSYQINVTASRPVRGSLDSTLRRRIEHMSPLDMELHALAQRRLVDDLQYLQRGDPDAEDHGGDRARM
jgi:hypothetical protein